MKKIMALWRARHAPLAAVVTLGLAILLVEFLLMVLFNKLPVLIGRDVPEYVLLIVDPLVLTVLISPLLYLLLFKPMRRHQMQLLDMNAMLEQRVLERARDLLVTQQELGRDIAERKLHVGFSPKCSSNFGCHWQL